MKKFLIYLSNSHEAILKGLIILITVGVIGTLLPHKVRYKFDFQKGKTWNNDDLIAPFDFAISKDKDALKVEKQHTRRDVLPHFQMDTMVFHQASKELEQRINSESLFAGRESNLYQNGKTQLQEIYAKGVIRDNEIDESGYTGQLILVKGKIAVPKNVNEFLTSEKALAWIKNQSGISDEYFEQKLDSMLATVITANVFFDQQLTESIRDQKEAEISPTRGMIQKGELVISRGELVTPEKLLVLESLKNKTETAETDRQTTREIYWGQLLIVAIALSILLIFLALLRKDIFADNRKLALIVTLMILVTAAYTGIM